MRGKKHCRRNPILNVVGLSLLSAGIGMILALLMSSLGAMVALLLVGIGIFILFVL